MTSEESATNPTIYWRAPDLGPTRAASPPRGRAYFHGTGGQLFRIHLKTLLLSVVTLGVFYFWGRVRARKYLWGEVDFDDDRFLYHGTGGELLVGFIKAWIIFAALAVLIFWGETAIQQLHIISLAGASIVGAVAVLLYLLFGLTLGVIATTVIESSAVVVQGIAGGAAGQLWQAEMLLAMLVVIPIALVGGRRFRMHRTSWRGIRFSFRSHALDLIGITLTGALLIPLTLGLYYPFFAVKKWSFLASGTYFGGQSFGFVGRGSDLMKPFVIAWLCTVPTFGLIWYWYRGRQQRYLWDHTTFGAGRFAGDMDGGGLFGLEFVNGLILLFTLGLGVAWVTIRKLEFLLNHVRLADQPDLQLIVQAAGAAGPVGQGMEDLLGFGEGLVDF